MRFPQFLLFSARQGACRPWLCSPPSSSSLPPVSLISSHLLTSYHFSVHNHPITMFSSIVILSTLAASALGSNSASYQLPAGFNIGLVKPDELSMLSLPTAEGQHRLTQTDSWCLGQRNVCPQICTSGTKSNYCDPVSDCLTGMTFQFADNFSRTHSISTVSALTVPLPTSRNTRSRSPSMSARPTTASALIPTRMMPTASVLASRLRTAVARTPVPLMPHLRPPLPERLSPWPRPLNPAQPLPRQSLLRAPPATLLSLWARDTRLV